MNSTVTGNELSDSESTASTPPALKTESFESETARGLTQWDIWAGLIPLVAMLPMLFIQIQGLWSRTHMQFFPIMLLAAAWFAWKGWKDSGESTHPVRRWTAIGLLATAMLIYLASVWKFSPWLCHVAAIIVFFAWALGRCGRTPVPTLVAWSALLLTTLPLPLNRDVQLIQWLQMTSSNLCALALDALNIPNIQLANVIQIEGQRLFVEEACSGIGSLYALLAVGVLLLILNGRSLFVSVLALLTVPAWAVVGNFVRLLSIVIAREYYDHDLSHGTDHDLLGMGTFLLAAGCFWLTENFLAQMLRPVPIAEAEFGLVFSALNQIVQWPHVDPHEEAEPEDEDDRLMYLRMKAVREARKWRFSPLMWKDKPWAFRSVIACGAVMLLAGVAPLVVLARGGVKSISFGLPAIRGHMLDLFPSEEALPEKVGEFQRVGFRHEARSAASNFGQNSLIWEYSWNEQLVGLSLDFPFDGWHALSVCYGNSGWLIEKQRVYDDADSDEPWPWEEMEMVNELGGKGYVFFCAFTEDMDPFQKVPGGSVGERMTGSSGIMGALTGEPPKAIKTTYQIQLLCEAGIPLESADRQILRDQFLALRQLARDAAEPAVTQVE